MRLLCVQLVIPIFRIPPSPIGPERANVRLSNRTFKPIFRGERYVDQYDGVTRWFYPLSDLGKEEILAFIVSLC